MEYYILCLVLVNEQQPNNNWVYRCECVGCFEPRLVVAEGDGATWFQDK